VRERLSISRLLLLVLLTLVVAVIVLNWTYGRLPAEPRPTSGAFVQIGKLRIHYIEHPGNGIPVVLLHGLPGTAEDWEDVTPLLEGHRTIAIDRPGFGYSTGGYVPFNRQLEAIDALLHKLHVVRPILVGHSYGGTISLGFAERYPSEVRGLVLVDAAAGSHPDGFARLQAHFLHVLQLPVIWQIADVTFSQLLRKVSAELAENEAFDPQPVVAAHRQRVLAISMTRGNLEALAGEYLAADGVIAQVDRGLGAIKLPSVVIQGDADKFVVPSRGRRLAATLSDARLVMVYGGHMQPYDHPAAIAAAVQSLTGAPIKSPREPANAHSSKPRLNRAVPERKTFRRPSRPSARRAAETRRR
jgi:pimeloyl-ACP methyl ester carboxylesterase